MPVTATWWSRPSPEVLLKHLRELGFTLSENMPVYLKWHVGEQSKHIIGRDNVVLKDGKPMRDPWVTGGEHAVEVVGKGKQVVRPGGELVAEIDCPYVIETGEASTGGRNIGITFIENEDGTTDALILGDDILIDPVREKIKEALFKASAETALKGVRQIFEKTVGAGELRVKTEESPGKFKMTISKVKKGGGNDS